MWCEVEECCYNLQSVCMYGYVHIDSDGRCVTMDTSNDSFIEYEILTEEDSW